MGVNYRQDATIGGQATGAMSWAFITALKKNPQQSYVQLLNSIRDELATRYTQKPQLSCSHPLGQFPLTFLQLIHLKHKPPPPQTNNLTDLPFFRHRNIVRDVKKGRVWSVRWKSSIFSPAKFSATLGETLNDSS